MAGNAPREPVAPPRPPAAYRFCTRFIRQLIRVFFRQTRVTGLESVPAHGGGIVVAWHPNALLDGCLILAHFPGRVVIGARHGLFRWPLLGAAMRALGMVPVYRRQDLPAATGERERREANERSLDTMARAVAAGGFAALFPEGDSHDEPHPTELRTGAARLFYRARQLQGSDRPAPHVLPVGLHYDEKRLFGSRALVSFHPPLALDPELAEPPPAQASREAKREKYRRFTALLEDALHRVVHATESWDLHHAMHRARKLMRAERARRAGASLPRPDIEERVLGYARIWAGYEARARADPDRTRRLLERVRRYDADLTALGVEDHQLDADPRLGSPWLATILAVQALLVYMVLPPILVLGYVVNSPAALAVWAGARAAARKPKDEASLKLLLGSVAFPATWLLVGALVARGWTALAPLYPEIPGSPLVTGLLASLISAASAWVAFDYHRLAAQTLRAIRVRLTRLRCSDSLARLRSERAELHDMLVRLATGLELPGQVSRDGRILEGAG